MRAIFAIRAVLVAVPLTAGSVLALPAAAAPEQVTPEQPRAGQPIKVVADGFAPSSLVAVVFGDPPTKIGEGMVGPDGAVSVDAVLPGVLPAGPLGLRVVGVAADGSARTVAVTVDVTTGLATSGADLRLALVAVALVGGGQLLVTTSARTTARLVALRVRPRVVLRRRVAAVHAQARPPVRLVHTRPLARKLDSSPGPVRRTPAPTVIRLRRRA